MHKSRCGRCKKIYEYEGLPPQVCPACQNDRNEQLYIMRAIIRDVRGMTVTDLHRITGVPVGVITPLVQDGVLEYLPEIEITEELEERVQKAVQDAKMYKGVTYYA